MICLQRFINDLSINHHNLSSCQSDFLYLYISRNGVRLSHFIKYYRWNKIGYIFCLNIWGRNIVEPRLVIAAFLTISDTVLSGHSSMTIVFIKPLRIWKRSLLLIWDGIFLFLYLSLPVPFLSICRPCNFFLIFMSCLSNQDIYISTLPDPRIKLRT